MNVVNVSRYISYLLRHKPEDIGLVLDEHGYGNVEKLCQGVGISFADLELIVTNDDKQRYSFNEDKTLTNQARIPLPQITNQEKSV